MDADQAETIALAALAFLAEDAQRLGRFLALTGLGPAELREQAQTPRFSAAVLDHLLRDESLLLVFAASRGVAPELIAPAQSLLEQQSAEAATLELIVRDAERASPRRQLTRQGLARARGLFLEERQLLELAADGEVAVVDIELRRHAVLVEAEGQLVGRHRIGLLRARLEVADGDRPGGKPLELLAVGDARRRLSRFPAATRGPIAAFVS